MARGSTRAPTASRGSALRRRVHGTAHAAAESATTVLGSAHANAYFNAKRLKSAGTGSTRKRRATQPDEDAPPPDETPTDLHESTTFVMRPVSETAAILRRMDAREDAWRRRSPGQAWPTFDHLFPRWLSQLRAGFSVLLHGVGSKMELLQRFAATLPETAYVVHIHGELPSVALRDVLALLQHEVLALPDADAAPPLASLSFVQQCRTLVDFAFAHRDQSFAEVYLVVHSLDGPALRDPELQAGLARLTRAPPVKLIASVDSVNAPALWAEDDVQRFRWLHHRVDTLRPHTRELDLRLSREGKAAEQTISGVRYILQSLTPTDVGTLRLIAQLQIADGDCAKPETTGQATRRGGGGATREKHADYHAVYVGSRKQLLHATMQSLKNSVKCLEDNGLVQLLRVKNTEKLTIPLADELLRSEIIAPVGSGSSSSSKK